MNDDPDWNLHRTFLAVVQEGSLSAAARRLGLTQPTVARHVEALEAAIGRALFVRSPRGLVPTDLAAGLVPHAETMASTAAAWMRVASGAADEVAGTVRVSASEVVGVERLPPILAALRRTHPRLVVELVLSNDVHDLLRHEADIAVRMTDPAQSALVARRLPPVVLGLHAHAAYLDRRGTPDTSAELVHHDLIGFDRETPALRRLVARFPVLVRVLAHEIDIALGLWIVMHEDLGTSARCRVVFDALVAGMG
jgi:DNA-binding transcriptional LysR family regulator